MSAPQSLKMLAGEWRGIYQLWFMPEDPVRKSNSTASIAPIGNFVMLQYTWVFDGAAQAGLLLIGQEDKTLKVVWIDSWHTGDKYMLCEGDAADSTALSFRGSYAAPPGPDWGWRTVIEPQDDSFKMGMYNVTPEGEEMIAVEGVYEKTIHKGH